MGLLCFSEKIGGQPFLRWRLHAAVLACALTSLHAGTEPTVGELERICRIGAETIQKAHYSARPLDETIARRMLVSYIDALDRRHMVFVQSDLDEFSKHYLASDRARSCSRLAESVARGDLTPAREIYARYLIRLRERMAQIESLCQQTPDFSVEESWMPDRSLAAWPRDAAEADELWRLRIKHEWLAEVLAGKSEEETVTALASGYIQRFKAAQVDGRNLLRTYLTALARAYDPHSAYYTEQGKAGSGLRHATMARNDGEPTGQTVEALLAENVVGDARLGVVRLPVFTRGSAQEVAGAVKLLMSKRPTGLVLDLRGNQGGSIDEAVRVAGLFVGVGPVLLCKDRNGMTETQSSDDRAICTLPLVILVNRATASAAEIVAGALQDYGRAIVVGSETTFGKGTLQGIIPLSRVASDFSADPGELKVTIRQYYRITGAPMQGRGIHSDVVLPQIGDKSITGEASLPNALAADSVAPVCPVNSTARQTLLAALRERSAQRVRQSREFECLQQMQVLSVHSNSLLYDKRLADLETVRKLQAELESLPGEWWLCPIPENPGSRTVVKRDCLLEEAVAILWDSIEIKPADSGLVTAKSYP